MTRSYKKHPIWRDNDGAGKKKSYKEIYNRRIRRNDNIEQSITSRDGDYRKVNESWNICDFAFYPDPDDPKDIARARRK